MIAIMPPNPNRLFIKVHNGFPEHPKTVELSDKAFRQLVEAWCFCGRNLNDGRLTQSQFFKLFSQKSRRELVAAGFITESLGGVEMHDYLDHQQSAQEVADLRERRAEAGSKGGRAKANRLASARAVAKQTPSKRLADTDTDTDTEELASASSCAGTALAVADDPPRSDVEAICEHLADRIAEDGSKRPDIGKGWNDAARLMLDKDGRTKEEVHTAIDWCQNHHFWRTNVLSMPTLRQKYDQLRKVAMSELQPRPGSSRTEEWKAMQERQMTRAIERERQMGLR